MTGPHARTEVRSHRRAQQPGKDFGAGFRLKRGAGPNKRCEEGLLVVFLMDPARIRPFNLIGEDNQRRFFQRCIGRPVHYTGRPGANAGQDDARRSRQFPSDRRHDRARGFGLTQGELYPVPRPRIDQVQTAAAPRHAEHAAHPHLCKLIGQDIGQGFRHVENSILVGR
jgi:hypothetical protein